MMPEQLKYSILKKAFSGQLVSVKPDKEKPKVKPIEYDETPYDIPEDWFWSNLGNCCDLYTGNSISKSVKEAKYKGLKEGYDYIATKDVSFEHTIEYDNGVKIPFDNEFRIAYKGSVLMCIEGGSAGRKIGILDRDVCFGNKLCSFNSSYIFNKYIYYYLQSYEFKAFFMNKMTGIIGGVSIKGLKELPIPIPTVSEQKAIVDKIEELLPYVEQYADAYEELNQFNDIFPEDMKKSILKYAVQGKLVEQRLEEGTAEEQYQQIQIEKQKMIKEGKIKQEKNLAEIEEDEIPYIIPKNWKWVRVGALGSWASGATPSRSEPKYYGGDIPWLKTGDLNDGFVEDVQEYITELALEKTSVRLNPAGAVLMAMYGATIGKLGILKKEMTTNQACCACITFKGVFNKYLFYYLMSQRKTYIGMSEGGAQPNISKAKIINSLIPLPPLKEQHRIVSKIEELLPFCDALKSC